MFELTEEDEIKKNISFFQELIKLCMHSNTEQNFSVVLYKGMIDKMNQRSIQPFPIKLEVIQDRDLKDTIMQINRSFNNALLNFIESIDIDACKGDQNFEITENREILDDDKYYEMLCTLLIPCYMAQTVIDDKILTGQKAKGRQIGDKFQITCSCSEKRYIKNCMFADLDAFISQKSKVIKALKVKRKKGEIPIVKSVPAEMGKHHNHVTPDGKSFDSLNKLSYRNKSVLILLQKLGLFNVVFGRFDKNEIKTIGTMSIYSVTETEIQDIVRVRFFAETGFRIDTDLYFPKGIGKLLYQYFQKEQLVYKNVYELVEQIE